MDNSKILDNLHRNRLTLDAMKLLLPIITAVWLAATFNADAREEGTTKCLVNQPANAESQLLQGTWEGVRVGDKAKITVTITGNSLHFHRDKNFWFETTMALPAGKAPKQLHATIKDCAEKGSIGEVVKAFYKIEDGTLTLVTIGEEPPESFEATEGRGDRYELRKALPQKKVTELPKSKQPGNV